MFSAWLQIYNVNVDFKKKCNSDQWWNNDKCQCERKECHVGEKDYIENPATWSCKSRTYLPSIMDDSAIMCAEIVES